MIEFFMQDWIAILPDALPADRVMQFAADPCAGGISLFVGTTRCESPGCGRELVALDYEAYEQMALRQLQDLAARARRQWPLVKVVILHRVGRVPLAAASVIIAVSAAHRAEAFAACRWIIDTLKAEVTIWKKEIWADGSTAWVDPQARQKEAKT